MMSFMDTMFPAAWTPASVRAARANATYAVLVSVLKVYDCILP